MRDEHEKGTLAHVEHKGVVYPPCSLDYFH